MSIHQSMEDKAAVDKEYFLSVWKSHITNLCRLVDYGEGTLTYERYEEIRDELMVNADATWEHTHGS